MKKKDAVAHIQIPSFSVTIFYSYSVCHERGTKKNSESPTGIEPMTSRTPVGALTTELLGDSWRARSYLLFQAVL